MLLEGISMNINVIYWFTTFYDLQLALIKRILKRGNLCINFIS